MKPIRALSSEWRLKIQRWLGRQRPPVYTERVGYLGRLLEIGSAAGFDQGFCIDRYYIERFLSEHAQDIRGVVLEVGDDTYTRKFGGERVTRSDVLHKTEDNPGATIVADLTGAEHIPRNAFDCIILTQTLQYIYELPAAISTLHYILKPGGVVLVTCPGIAHISRYDLEHWGEYWRFTSLSAKRLFEDVFPPENITVQTYGNLLTAVAFLCGLPSEGFKQGELGWSHPDFQLLVAVRAVK